MGPFLGSWARWAALGLIIIALVGVGLGPQGPDERLAAAIYRAEGGLGAARPYGIRGILKGQKEKGLRMCLNTIRHARERYAQIGEKGKRSEDFIVFLSKTYCPGSDRGHWALMVKRILK